MKLLSVLEWHDLQDRRNKELDEIDFSALIREVMRKPIATEAQINTLKESLKRGKELVK